MKPVRFLLLTIFAVLTGLCASAPAMAESWCNSERLKADLQTYGPYTVKGRKVLALAGGVRPGSYSVVSGAIASRNYDEIWLCSGGGNVDAGLAIGRALSRVKAKVVVPKGFDCASSCTNITLGGYFRTIEEGANFVIHAQSSVNGSGNASRNAAELLRDRKFIFDCQKSSACSRLFAELKKSPLKYCTSVDDYENSKAPCGYLAIRDMSSLRVWPTGDVQSPQGVGVKISALVANKISPALFSEFFNTWYEDQYEDQLKLLAYYQEMLNDGNASVINQTAYQRMRSSRLNSRPYGTTQSPGRQSLVEDYGSISVGQTWDDRMVIWQELLAKVEVQSQKDLVIALSSRTEELGRGGKAALEILKATSVCRIQNACYLDRHQTASLGYHNFDDVQ